jgi:hypothetical protein
MSNKVRGLRKISPSKSSPVGELPFKQSNDLFISIDKHEYVLEPWRQLKHEALFNSKASSNDTKIRLLNLSGVIQCFDYILQGESILFAISLKVAKSDTDNNKILKIRIRPFENSITTQLQEESFHYSIVFAVFNSKTCEFDKLYAITTKYDCRIIRIHEETIHAKSDANGYGLFMLTNDGDFIYQTFEIERKSKLSNLFPISIESTSESRLSKLKQNHFTCFDTIDLVSSNGYRSFKLIVGTENGAIYQYIFTDKTFHLVQVFNFGCNFYISEIKYQISNHETTRDCFNPSYFSAITLDGIFKIFVEQQGVAVFELAMQNKPLRSLFWDTNMSLIFFLDETDRNLLTALSFSRPVDAITFDNIKRNIKLGTPSDRINYSYIDEQIVSINSDNFINVGSLKVV